MSASEKTDDAPEDPRTSGIYVYGIVPADVEAEEDAVGVCDGPVSIIKHGDIAALVSEISVDRPLGKPADLQAHAHLLDGTSRVAPVLPLRFGAVLTDEDAVEEELLSAHADEFASALNELEGRAQYVVKGRYVEEAILREVIEENDQAGKLLGTIRDQPEEATRDARMALGEIVSNAIEAKRDEDTRTVVEALDSLTDAINVREPTHEEEAAQVAILVEVARQEELEEVVGGLAEQWDGRVEMRLLGPLAAYDFVVTQKPEG
ncbi:MULTISPECIES: GvpL/GvpF family gas vesicle protein [unclassified Rhodococcus (in: high G+C Gram-positive bacteria)]|uniref:GvpL/GvpF family gas vesicle protein n=1 Tax=unclassified Rhodococcus (in: high G+C Gram-positive bacteria) TaxID=192944 RepID=UPI00163AB4E1|nr:MULTISPECIES: GvpL/GvpF family gas vesicle protein [unclassified Rhodococcus (in: high G+C Gram-positive bacteria)]MBC2638148.1 GvpL/GvpF family gas vesicle protein [Rhodococcus sp. 3A]MBC2897109.1 GvpL/GvpF family gas vesicle protein [Rhodococcus sp. 4CII]